MSEYIRADKQILVAAFGFSTALLTGVVLGYVEIEFGFAFYSWMFWFVIPVGAILSGFGAASGYYAGAMLFHQKPAGGVLLNMLGASIGAFFIIHYIPYFMFEIDGIHIKEVMSFWKYLDIGIRNTSLSFLRSSVSTGELGSFWGYGYAILQLIGFSVGGFAVFGWLSQNPYCDNCSRYLKKTGKQELYTSEGAKLLEQIKEFASLLAAEQCNDAIRYHTENMGVEYSSGHHLRSRVVTRKCSGCGINHLDFVTAKLNGNDWKDIDDTRISLFTNEQLNPVGSK